MKRISSNQSRVNSARRKRKVRARHGQAGHWNARRQPMFNAGPVHYEVGANTDAMSFGGIAAVHRLVTKLGLVQHIDDRLELLKVHLPYHESDHVLNLAYNVLCGGTRLEDIERLRHDTAYMNALGADLIPDPTTAGDFCRRFREEDVITLMECINAVRAPLWQGRGRELLGPAGLPCDDVSYHSGRGAGLPAEFHRARAGPLGQGSRRLERAPRYETLTGLQPDGVCPGGAT